MKPSEKDPQAAELLTELSQGIWPDGVLNIMQGGKVSKNEVSLQGKSGEFFFLFCHFDRQLQKR